jgi:hypothetical protein
LFSVIAFLPLTRLSSMSPMLSGRPSVPPRPGGQCLSARAMVSIPSTLNVGRCPGFRVGASARLPGPIPSKMCRASVQPHTDRVDSPAGLKRSRHRSGSPSGGVGDRCRGPLDGRSRPGLAPEQQIDGSARSDSSGWVPHHSFAYRSGSECFWDGNRAERKRPRTSPVRRTSLPTDTRTLSVRRWTRRTGLESMSATNGMPDRTRRSGESGGSFVEGSLTSQCGAAAGAGAASLVTAIAVVSDPARWLRGEIRRRAHSIC